MARMVARIAAEASRNERCPRHSNAKGSFTMILCRTALQDHAPERMLPAMRRRRSICRMVVSTRRIASATLALALAACGDASGPGTPANTRIVFDMVVAGNRDVYRVA